MMIEKTIRVFSAKKAMYCAGYSVAALAVLLCLRFDVFKVENRVPKASEVAWVGIESQYTMVFTSEDEINTAISLHKNFLADKKELRDVNVKYEDVDGTYINEVLPQKMKWNLSEIKKYGFWRDIKIMFMTVFAVLGKDYKEES